MWNTAEFGGIEELLTEDFELRESPGFEPSAGIDNFKRTVLAYHRSYPDFHITVDEVTYGSERVTAIWTIRATNTGAGPRPPTGIRVGVTEMSVIHFRDGKISDEWIAGNDFEWYRQLGYEMVPQVGGASE
jgi:predicted ester cyclase